MPPATSQVPKARAPRAPSAQKFLDVWEIKDDVVILRDGTVRAVLLVSSMNFALKSDEEQAAVIQAYTQFLNTLDFPLQICIQSRKLNIDPYLDNLKQLEKTQANELLKMQTQEYVTYVRELVELADIMAKRFYVVVPYQPGSGKRANFFKRLTGVLSPTNVIHIKQKRFDELRGELLKRVDFVADGLSALGLKAVPLDTQGLIELFYNTYNPQTSAQEKFSGLEQMSIER
ncbi:MAG: TraC family protein [bacterium]|nr:TraC family protein [bacterium]